MIENQAKQCKDWSEIKKCTLISGCGEKTSLNAMMQGTANENAAGLRRICKRSDQPKIERQLSKQ